MDGKEQPFAWSCATLPANASICPAEPPAEGSACATSAITQCTYCGRKPNAGIEIVVCHADRWSRPQGEAR
jgi:hypothetical protein